MNDHYLTPYQKGYIRGMLNAADMLTEHRVEFHSERRKNMSEKNRRHHRACYNTLQNKAQDVQWEALRFALAQENPEE